MPTISISTLAASYNAATISIAGYSIYIITKKTFLPLFAINL
ncbi:hypothetical protein HMPREF1864_01323 [Peptoniphilus sp. DNF00840]|nr:hypothetical protein HMPREF1864_01323 [Peptoniphilus sp. DNF00840]